MDNIKIKNLTKEQLIISFDRLTRFKETEKKYMRVFIELILSNLIIPKFKKHELERLDYSIITKYATELINESLSKYYGVAQFDKEINERIKIYENSIFNLSVDTNKLLNNSINYNNVAKLLAEMNPEVNNLLWLKTVIENKNQILEREKNKILYPIQKILIVEGITEEILLPKFAKLMGFDLNKHGIYVYSAGGKNQVVKLYYELFEKIKIPIFILLDNDATDNIEQISRKIRNIDNFHLIKCGEFEDMLPLNLIKRTLNYELENISIIEEGLLESENSKVKMLENIFKTRGRHEFKKAEFATAVNKNIKDKQDLSPEIIEIIDEIRK